MTNTKKERFTNKIKKFIFVLFYFLFSSLGGSTILILSFGPLHQIVMQYVHSKFRRLFYNLIVHIKSL